MCVPTLGTCELNEGQSGSKWEPEVASHLELGISATRGKLGRDPFLYVRPFFAGTVSQACAPAPGSPGWLCREGGPDPPCWPQE